MPGSIRHGASAIVGSKIASDFGLLRMEPGSKGPARPRGAKGPGVLLVALILILGCSLPLAILWPMQSSAQIASHVLLDRAVAGVTGTLFEGKPTRVYGGKWLFKNDVQKPYRRPHSSHGLWSAKWAVVTTINSPTAQIMDTVNLKVVLHAAQGNHPPIMCKDAIDPGTSTYSSRICCLVIAATVY